ncbi:Clavaminate synthase-like protein, partial [Ascoidea rubescens DSM 1968]
MSSNPLQIVDFKQRDEHKIASELLDAAMNQGFLFIDGHDFSQDEVSHLFLISKHFFDLLLAEKTQIPIDEQNFGYSDLFGELLDEKSNNKRGDPKEAFNFANLNFESGLPSHDLPDFFTNDNDKMVFISNIIKKLYNVSIKILYYLALALNIDDSKGGKNWFIDRHRPDKKSGSVFRFLKYPSLKSIDSENLVRAGAHTDYGGLTLLFQQENQEGLQIFFSSSKKWESVPYIDSIYKNKSSAPPIIVNIADQLSYWTNGILKSTIHRVQFPIKSIEQNKDRYSIVFFSHPEDETALVPIPSDFVNQVKNRGASNSKEVLTAKQHLDRRLAATYGWKTY